MPYENLPSKETFGFGRRPSIVGNTKCLVVTEKHHVEVTFAKEEALKEILHGMNGVQNLKST